MWGHVAEEEATPAASKAKNNSEKRFSELAKTSPTLKLQNSLRVQEIKVWLAPIGASRAYEAIAFARMMIHRL